MTKKKTTKKTTTTTVVTTEEVIGNKTHIICILDGSSSMNSIIDEARDGFNNFVKEQKELDGEAVLTVATFSSGGLNNGYKLLFNSKPIDEVEPLTKNDWYGNGMTALYDAIGKAITDVNRSHEAMSEDERPDRVLVAIVTDGEENSSREFNQTTIKGLVTKMEKQNWKFVYLAADQDATFAGTSIGVSAGNTLKYRNSKKGNTSMFNVLSNATFNYRSATYTDSVGATLMSDVTDGKGEVDE